MILRRQQDCQLRDVSLTMRAVIVMELSDRSSTSHWRKMFGLQKLLAMRIVGYSAAEPREKPFRRSVDSLSLTKAFNYASQ